MTNYEINWQSMAPGPYLSEKYEWSLDMSDSDASCNSSPVDSNSVESYQSSPTGSTWDYIPMVEKALGSMPIDELFPEPGLGNHQELLNYDYCDNSLESKHTPNLSPLDLLGDINNFSLPDTVDPMSNEDTTKFDLTQFLCEDMIQDSFDVKICNAEPFQTEVAAQPAQDIKIEPTTVKQEEPQIDSETEIDVESVPDDFKPFFNSVDDFQPHHNKGKFKAKEKTQKKCIKKAKVVKKVENGKPGKVLPTKTVPIGRKDLKQFAKATASTTTKKHIVNVTHGVVEKITPPAIIEASDGIGLLDRLEMFDLQINQEDKKPIPKKQAKAAPQRRTIPVEALPQSNKRSKGKEVKRIKEEPKEPSNSSKTTATFTEPEKKKQTVQPIRTLKEIPVINPQDWLYTPQKIASSTKQKPPIAKLKLVRSLPDGQKTAGQQISAAVLQQLQEKTKNKKIIVTQMLPMWKVEKSSNTRTIQLKAQTTKVLKAAEISTQTEPEVKKIPQLVKKSWQNDHDYLNNGASLVKNSYKPPMVSILKANVNKLKAQTEHALAQKKKVVQEVVQLKRKLPDEAQEVQPKKVLKLEDYKQRKPIQIIKTEIKQEPIIENKNITLAPFVPPSEIPQTPTPEEIKQEHPYVAPRPIPKHLQMKISRGANTSQSWAHLEQMAKNHGLQFSCNSLISSMLEQLPENDISDKIFEDVVVSFAEKKKEKVETREIGIQVGTVSRSRSRSQSPVRQTYGMQKSLGRGWGNKARTFKDILDSVMERRVVFVGGIKEGTTNAQLAGLFVRFGDVEHTNIIYDKKWQDGPDYCGFVTFKKADIAYEVISSGNLYDGLENFQLSFGGRRLFLQTPGYSDLDNVKDDEIYVREDERHEESFAESLKIAHRMLLKKLGKVS